MSKAGAIETLFRLGFRIETVLHVKSITTLPEDLQNEVQGYLDAAKREIERAMSKVNQ